MMNKDPEPVDFSSGPKEGSVEIQKTWAKGTLNLIFDNSAAMFFKNDITYELVIDAAE